MSSQSPRLYLMFNCQLKAKSENGDGRKYNQERFEDPQVYSEAVDRRQTENIVAKRKWSKIQTMISVGQHEPHRNMDWTPCFGRVRTFCSTSGIHLVTLVPKHNRTTTILTTFM